MAKREIIIKRIQTRSYRLIVTAEQYDVLDGRRKGYGFIGDVQNELIERCNELAPIENQEWRFQL